MKIHESTLTRIFTEDIQGTRFLVDQFFEGYTLFHATGLWKGKPEQSLCIEIADADQTLILALVRVIKEKNRQESVLVQTLPIQAIFL